MRYISIILFLIYNICEGQVFKTETYFFKVEHLQNFKPDTTSFVGFDAEFIYNRVYIEDSIFVENDFMGHTDTFRINQSSWILYKKGNKIPFCTRNDFKNKVPQKWGVIFLIPSEVQKTESGELYVYTISSDVKIDDCCVDLYFDPKYGFVKIRFNNFSLIRTNK